MGSGPSPGNTYPAVAYTRDCKGVWHRGEGPYGPPMEAEVVLTRLEYWSISPRQKLRVRVAAPSA